MRALVPFLLMNIVITACTGSGTDPLDLDPAPNKTITPALVNNDQTIQSIGDCPVTKSGEPPFFPPAPGMKLYSGQFWFGTDQLWTSLPKSGEWTGLPYSTEGYTQKTFWWSEGYSAADEPQPDLSVTGNRLDLRALKLHASNATHALNTDIGSAMLKGIVLPTAGCWEITGQYQDTWLRYVIWVS